MEIMIVIFLIGLIGSIIGYNMKGSLDEGRYFQSQQSIKQIKELLMLEVARGVSMDKVIGDPGYYLNRSGIIRDVDKVLKDGWGNDFKVTSTKDGDIEVTSAKFEEYDAKRRRTKK